MADQESVHEYEECFAVLFPVRWKDEDGGFTQESEKTLEEVASLLRGMEAIIPGLRFTRVDSEIASRL